MRQTIGALIIFASCSGIGNTAAESETLPKPIKLVQDNKAMAVVVTPDNPQPIVKYAAAELVRHIKLATGVELSVAMESEIPSGYANRILLGTTQISQRHNIATANLAPEAFVIRSIGNDLFIAGQDDDADPLNPGNSMCGTLFGVYEFIERVLQVRWLWPGDLGTYVPQRKELVVAPFECEMTPALRFRELVWTTMRGIHWGKKIDPKDAALGFSQDVAKQYAEALAVLLRRHRMGGISAKPSTGHTFQGWWKRYGKEHPEWFVLRQDGTRGNPNPDMLDVDICVSNEELQNFVVEQWDGESVLRLGPVDRPGRCTCAACRAWDGPQPAQIPWFAKVVYESEPRARGLFAGATSDRYARFWKVIQEKARKRNPNVVVSGSFIYENEFPAPVTGIKLNDKIYAEFVQWQDPHLRWFPMPEEAFKWIKEQWLGWEKTGIRMGYRPNYLHNGYVMPHVETRQSSDFFKFAYAHGMEGARFDSLTGQWAAHSLGLYVHLRLLCKPELELETIRQEYFAAFGPAAGKVAAYMDYWENYAAENVMRFLDLFQNPFVGYRYRAFPLKVHVAYPEDVFEPAASLLEEAMTLAQTETTPECAVRVAFLQTGLRHALLTVRLARVFDGKYSVPANRKAEAKALLDELVAFRKAHQSDFFSDLLTVTSFWERPCWNLDALMTQKTPPK